MARSVFEVFRALVRWHGGPVAGPDTDERGDGRTGERRFVPSPLDLSVRIGHGGSDDAVVRELSKVDERARELEAADRGAE
ncbi:MAG: hypothetical protein ABEJ74_05995 [Haloferacaceae archaeon]